MDEIGRMFSVVSLRILHIILRFITAMGLLGVILSISDSWRWRGREKNRPQFPLLARRSGSYQVLLYHKVNDKGDTIFSSIPVSSFEQQMLMLKQYFNVLPLEELVERAARLDVPPGSIAVTFDDGYKDNYRNAYPILTRYELPATIFLATDPIESGKPLWHDRVFHAFRRTTKSSFLVGEQSYSLQRADDKLAALRRCLSILRKSSPHDRDDEIRRLMMELGVFDGDIAEEMLDWSDVVEMSRNNITFGAHTVTHPILSRLPLDEAQEEIIMSRERIQQQIGSSVKLFAYPNGTSSDFTERVKGVLMDAGFLCAVTTIWGNNDSSTDRYELRRMHVWEQNAYMFAFRLGWYKFFC
jgi:peptidoglycan/xylan/chitin deacetylase (PgdA/CDA1 family)